jgi:hypothetical protein
LISGLLAAVFNNLFYLGAPCTGGSFFGLTPWYAYLDGETDALGRCVPKIADWADTWKIALAITDSLLKIAGMVAVGYVIYGGVKYVVSSGEPDKTKQARETIINALIGLVIAIIASSVVSFIGSRVV